MIIDKNHKNWALFSLLFITISTTLYIFFSYHDPRNISSGGIYGVIYGVIAASIIVFVSLLGVRKKLPTLQIGGAETWLSGHIWLGLCSIILILLHSGFSSGGTLTTVLSAIYTIIILSGVIGLALQQYLPKLIMLLENETIYDQINRVIFKTLEDCDDLINNLYGTLDTNSECTDTTKEPELLKDFYYKEIRPFLDNTPIKLSDILNKRKRKLKFKHTRKIAPAGKGDVIDLLEAASEKRCQLAIQILLQRWLHGWMFIHVPLTISFLILLFVHIFFALRY